MHAKLWVKVKSMKKCMFNIDDFNPVIINDIISYKNESCRKMITDNEGKETFMRKKILHM